MSVQDVIDIHLIDPTADDPRARHADKNRTENSRDEGTLENKYQTASDKLGL